MSEPEIMIAESRRPPMLGDLVKPMPGVDLSSGFESYDHAVVVQVDPFVLVSTAGDMIWMCTVDRQDFEPIWKQVPSEVELLMRRLTGGLTNRAVKRARCKVRRAYRLRGETPPAPT